MTLNRGKTITPTLNSAHAAAGNEARTYTFTKEVTPCLVTNLSNHATPKNLYWQINRDAGDTATSLTNYDGVVAPGQTLDIAGSVGVKTVWLFFPTDFGAATIARGTHYEVKGTPYSQH